MEQIQTESIKPNIKEAIPSVVPAKPKSKTKLFGWGMVVILGVIWIGLLVVYFAVPGKQMEVLKLPAPSEKKETTPSALLEPTEAPLSSSDSAESLSTDLTNTNVDNLDKELGTVEGQLGITP